MLFNSYIFILCFLPIVLVGFHLLGSKGRNNYQFFWLILASSFFYGWWNPSYLVLILSSIIFNYSFANVIRKYHSPIILSLGIVFNLGLIGYYKYANFFVDNYNYLFGQSVVLESIVLPLAISFFTFQQITYLVDTFRGETGDYRFSHYCLFVLFFPQLIAGPIVHHKEMMPQFIDKISHKITARNMSIGMTLFVLGLFKKVVLADQAALYSTPVFEFAGGGNVEITFFEAWAGALAYTFQLYFDFSGYSDMALGIARMFGIILPINFFSPYKATSIIEFWRRWHITLSKFLRDYLYISLGGNRKGTSRRYINLMLTMLLGGLWHGAGWTFIIWGGLHGIYLVINHAWGHFCIKQNLTFNQNLIKVFYWLLTFVAVVIAWVMFRADSISTAMNIYAGMFGFNSITFSASFVNKIVYLTPLTPIYLVMIFYILLRLPNTVEFLHKENPALHLELYENYKNGKIVWKPTVIFAIGMSFLAILAFTMIQKESEFLYFQF